MDIDDFVELPSDVPLSVDGTVLDPPSMFTRKKKKNRRFRFKSSIG